MAKEKKNQPLAKASEGTMADLIGPSVQIQVSDGESVIVPSAKAGNRVANMILAAQIRHLIQNSIKTYKDKEMLPTPKDLKDLAEAAKSLHQFSGEVYKEDDSPIETPKKIEKGGGSAAADVDFDGAFDTPAVKPTE